MSIENGQPRPMSHARPTGGIYSAPVVGPLAADVRTFFDEMAPKESDSGEVKVAKQVLRWTTVGATGLGAAALTAVVVL